MYDATTFYAAINRKTKQLLSWNADKCRRFNRDYHTTSYDDLMNTTFALVPSGRSPATYRLAEALSAGALPVFIHQVRRWAERPCLFRK